MTKTYLVGRLNTRAFRTALDYLVANGEATYVESKGFFECYFHVNSSDSIHKRILNVIRIYNSKK